MQFSCFNVTSQDIVIKKIFEFSSNVQLHCNFCLQNLYHNDKQPTTMFPVAEQIGIKNKSIEINEAATYYNFISPGMKM